MYFLPKNPFMPIATKAVLLASCLALCHLAAAQKNLVPVSQSQLTGVALPTGTKEDRRLLMRTAAKATMDMQAKDSGLVLTDRYEVFLLPASSAAWSTDSLRAAFMAKGWLLSLSNDAEQWALATKSDDRMLLYLSASNKETWLYLAEVNRPQRVTAVDPLPESKTDETTQPQPATNPVLPADTGTTTNSQPVAHSGRYQFTTTNFDDGWTATEYPDWIELSKGNMKVLLHLYNAAVDMSSGQTPLINASAWDVLVAPRYVSKREYYAFNGNMSYMRSSATSAWLTDSQGGEHYVVLFRRGGGPFMEFIAPDRASFEKEFGMNISEANSQNLIWSDDALWMKMDNMQRRNKFAVAPADLAGHWTESSSAVAQMYYVNSGNYAGMNAVSTSAEFWLQPDGSYRSQHKGASGMVGNQQFFQQEYKGKYSMSGNWELSMNNRYNGKTDVFLCQFEVVRGGRILHLTDKANPGLAYHLAITK